MNRIPPRLPAAVLFASLAMGACTADAIVDDWGPPAGYARLMGRVTNIAGNPVSAVEVTVTNCSNPFVGPVGSARTSADGIYRMTGVLPPVGAFPGRVDTLRTRCGVFINRNPAAVDSVEVRFAADSLTLPPQVLDLVVP